jgi:hypothetical protein
MPNWRSKKAQNLVRHYLQHKARAKIKTVKQPKFIAGNLLVAYGMQALGAYHEAQRKFGNAFPKQVGQLVREALNAELRSVHGSPTCTMCDRKAEPHEELVDWLVTLESLRWCCPECADKGLAKEGEELPGSQLLMPNKPVGVIEREELD